MTENNKNHTSEIQTSAVTIATTTAAAETQKKRKGKKRKKKISKHISEALATASRDNNNGNDDALPQQQQPVDGYTQKKPRTSNVPKKKKKNKISNTKDPADAARYLETWKQNTEHWKFHKNTQSWLIRHMYDFDKIPKHVFALLLDYLQSADVQTIIRTRQDATRRALRYQKYTTTTTQQTLKEEETTTTTKTATNGVSPDHENDDDDDSHWKSLNDHDKRKEYKRARKVLECLPGKQ